MDVKISNDERHSKLKAIRDEVLNLKFSPLFEYRNANKFFPVIGQGDHYAKIMIIAEAPGLEEAKTGRPFVGKSGQILDRLFNLAGIKREQVYITNILKDRPPGNRDPKPDEIQIYLPFLERQISIIQPKKIMTLGRFAMQEIAIMFKIEKKIGKISQCHGQTFDGEAEYGKIQIIPMFHPAVAAYSAGQFSTLETDFKRAFRNENLN